MPTPATCPPGEELLMYAEGALEADQQARLEVHLHACQRCRDQLQAFVDLSAALGDAATDAPRLQEPCPSSRTLIAYAEGELDEESARHVRAYLIHCDKCFTDVLALEHAREAERTLWMVLIRALAELRRRRRRLVRLSAGEHLPPVPAVAVGPQGTLERLDLEVLFGPVLSPEGRFSLDLRVPEGERFEGRSAVARLRFAPHVFELHTRVERWTISLDHTFEGEYHGTVPPEEVREAIVQALEVSIL
jgi:hypothetical protein